MVFTNRFELLSSSYTSDWIFFIKLCKHSHLLYQLSYEAKLRFFTLPFISMRGPSRLPLTTEGHDRQPLNSMSVYSYFRKLFWGLCFHSLLQPSSTDVGTSPGFCHPNNSWVSHSHHQAFHPEHHMVFSMLQTQARAFWMETSSCERFTNHWCNLGDSNPGLTD